VSRYHVSQGTGGSQPFYISLYPVNTEGFDPENAAAQEEPSQEERIVALEIKVRRLEEAVIDLLQR
jgi:hypothetical protein